MSEGRMVISLNKRRAPKSETQTAGGCGLGLRGDIETDVRDSAANRLMPQCPGNRLSLLQERFKRCGFELHPLTGSSLLVTRWGLSKSVQDLDHAERFLAQISGGGHV